ncbi:MAG: DUF2158 domain-containing protein [Phycisphaerales bacterium]|nr:DUF2158 domain-containing protein [Phycisphaerales bacterium]
MAKFTKGDVVQLKSGGPRITVDEYGTFGMTRTEGVKCVWFDGSRRLEEVFDEALLTPAEPSVRVTRIERG